MRCPSFKPVSLVPILFGVLMTCSAFSSPAQAGPIATFQFTGEVYFSGEPWTSNGIGVGDTVNGIVSYDLASPDTDSDPDRGRYLQTLTMGVQISVGGFVFSSSDYVIDRRDDPLYGADGIGFQFNTDVSDGGITVLGLGNSPFFDLSGPTNIFDGDALPTQIDLSLFTDRLGGLLAAGQGATQLQYEITQVRQVPEPATMALLLLGLAGLAGFARRQRVVASVAGSNAG